MRAGLSARRAGMGAAGRDTLSFRSGAEIARELKRLETEMYRAARNLEFEQAAALRDQIEQLRKLELEISAPARRSTTMCRLALAAARGARKPFENPRISLPCRGTAPVSFAIAAWRLADRQARSSVVEHHLDMVVVGGSIPLAPTKPRAAVLNG